MKHDLKKRKFTGSTGQPQKPSRASTPPSVKKALSKTTIPKFNQERPDKIKEKAVPGKDKLTLMLSKQQSVRGFETKPEGEPQGPEFALHEFKNLQSLLNAWHYVNHKLNIAFDDQTKNAMDQLYDRYVQLLEIKNTCLGLYTKAVSHEHILVLDKSLLMQYGLLTDIEQLVAPCMENIAIFNGKLTNDINRLRLSEGILLDPTRFGQSIEMYKDALRKVNEEFVEKRELLAEIAQIMQELVAVIKENVELIAKGIIVAEDKGKEKEKSVYANAIKDLSATGQKLEQIAIYGNIDSLFS